MNLHDLRGWLASYSEYFMCIYSTLFPSWMLEYLYYLFVFHPNSIGLKNIHVTQYIFE